MMTPDYEYYPHVMNKMELKDIRTNQGMGQQWVISSYSPSYFHKTTLFCYFLKSCFYSELSAHHKTLPGWLIIFGKG